MKKKLSRLRCGSWRKFDKESYEMLLTEHTQKIRMTKRIPEYWGKLRRPMYGSILKDLSSSTENISLERLTSFLLKAMEKLLGWIEMKRWGAIRIFTGIDMKSYIPIRAKGRLTPPSELRVKENEIADGLAWKASARIFWAGGIARLKEIRFRLSQGIEGRLV